MEVRIEYHQPDAAWYAGFLKDGEQWIFDGALVGTGSGPVEALADLVGCASHLVLPGRTS